MMTPEINKQTIQAELYSRLKAAWVLCSLDVTLDTKEGPVTVDIALHTESFIFGRIEISPYGRQTPPAIPGIEGRTCKGLDDIAACVDWAVELQERYVRCQVVSAVA